jgi:probable HAF family extracellular repeat protein
MVLVAVVLPFHLRAQHTRYKLIDLGTLGGPSSAIAPTDFGGGENPGRGLTNDGVIVGPAETTMADPFVPNCASPDCFVSHAFVWKDGVLTDLGTTQGGSNSDLGSVAHWINDRGWIAGSSQVGGFDSLSGNPANHATLWRNGEIIDLGTLGGDFGGATAVNNRGQVS